MMARGGSTYRCDRQQHVGASATCAPGCDDPAAPGGGADGKDVPLLQHQRQQQHECMPMSY